MTKILDVIIPTYNRLSFLREQLIRICAGAQLSRAANCSVSIRVNVLDNCSNEYSMNDMVQVIDEIPYESIPIIKVHRNQSNIGFCKNVIQGIESLCDQLHASVVWILSDDDIIDPYGLSLLIRYIDAMQSVSDNPILLPWFCSGIGPLSTIRGLVLEIPSHYFGKLDLIHRNALISSWIYPGHLLLDGMRKMSTEEKENQFFQIILNANILSRNQIVVFDRCIGIERPNLVWRFDLVNTFVYDRVRAITTAAQRLGSSHSLVAHLNKSTFAFLCKRVYLSSLTSKIVCSPAELFRAGLRNRILSIRALAYLSLNLICNSLPQCLRKSLFSRCARENLIASSNQKNAEIFVLGIKG